MSLNDRDFSFVEPLGSTENLDNASTQVAVRFVAPWLGWSWYAWEAGRNPYEDDAWTFFGLVCEDGVGCGYFSTELLDTLQGPNGEQVIIDEGFQPITVHELLEQPDLSTIPGSLQIRTSVAAPLTHELASLRSRHLSRAHENSARTSYRPLTAAFECSTGLCACQWQEVICG